MKKDAETAQMKRRYARLAARLAKLGPVLQGTITERTVRRDDPRRPGEKKAYGPYYQWTFKRNGKTVTVNLSRSQAKVYQRAINNQRKLEETTQEMRELSLQILESTTTGVVKRKAKK
jgi:uncharacterized iron-regulated protein